MKYIRALAATTGATRLRRHAVSSLVLQGLGILSTLLTGVVLARALGPAEYGAWATCMAALATLAAFASLGLPNLVTRRVADHESRQEWVAASSAVSRSLQLSGLSALIIALAVMTIVFVPGSFGMPAALVAVTMSALPFMTVTTIWGGALRGLGHGVAAQVLPTLLRPLILLSGLCVMIFILRTDVDAFDAMLFNLAAAAITVLASAWLYRTVRPEQMRSVYQESVPRLWQEATPFLIVSVAALLGARVDLFLIAGMLGPTAAGYYDVAYRGAELVMLPLVATTAVLAPEYARRYAVHDRPGLQRLVTQSGRGLIMLSAPIAVCLVLWPDHLVRLVFGGEYVASTHSLMILAAGYLLTLAMGPVHVFLGMTGHSGASAAGALLAATLGAALSVAFIPKFGIEGAAGSRVLAQVLTAAALAWFARRRTGIHTIALAGGARS